MVTHRLITDARPDGGPSRATERSTEPPDRPLKKGPP